MLSAAIANEHRIRMLPSPTTHETISTLFRGFRNEHPQTRAAKLPITEEILDKMYAHLDVCPSLTRWIGVILVLSLLQRIII